MPWASTTTAAQAGAPAVKAPAGITIEFEQPVQITADKATNSLVIIASPQDYELLKGVIDKFDIRRPQVLVDALLVEMDYEKAMELGMEWRSTNDPRSGDTAVVASSNFGTIGNVAAGGPLALPQGLVLGAVKGTITFGGREFLNVAAVARALQDNADVNIVSTPTILTTDNEEAEIVVSDYIPYQTSQKFDNNGNPIFTFEYKDVGLTRKSVQKRKLLRSIKSLESDYILVDLGGGNTLSVLDFFLMSDGGILVVTPEPTSIENTYRFLKSAFYRRLRQTVSSSSVKALIDEAMDGKNEAGIRTPYELLREVRRISEDDARKMVEEAETFHPNLILNQVRSKKDIEIGFSIRTACQKYFGIHLHYLGYIASDQDVGNSIRKRKPLVLENNRSKAAQCVTEIASRLANSHRMRKGI